MANGRKKTVEGSEMIPDDPIYYSRKYTFGGITKDPESENFDFEVANEAPRVSCCYGIMVFLGLVITLAGLTVFVVYAGFWSNYSPSDLGLLIMIGGEVDDLAMDKVSIHFLTEDDPRCSEPPNYPLKVTGAVGIVVNHALTVCGGSMQKNEDLNESSKGKTHRTTNDCYRLDPDGWSLVDKLKQSRAFSASTFFPNRGWWITGGITYEHFDVLGGEKHLLSSTEIIPIFDDDRAEEYKFLVDEPNLPTEMGLSHHCLVKLDMHRVLLIGGQNGETVFTSDVWMFDWKRRKWDKWDDLKYGRHSHACSLALGGEYVIVAGGVTDYESVQGGGSQTAEIMEVTTGHWHIMPKLSKPLWGGVFVQIINLPFLIGGSPDNDSLPIQLIEKGDFQSTNVTFNPSIVHENERKYAVSVITQEKFVCF